LNVAVCCGDKDNMTRGRSWPIEIARDRDKLSDMAGTDSRKSISRPKGAGGDAPRYGAVFEKIYRIVLLIPRGRVMTYGQIARLLGGRYSPRLVGWAMHATPKDGRNIPWHRVINSRGRVSTGKVLVHNPDLQKWMLEAEGISFDDRDKCDLSVHQWSPRRPKARARVRAGRGRKRAASATTKK
jgi:methylated-DNA-protein-cysteine methyltransferase-like protein